MNTTTDQLSRSQLVLLTLRAAMEAGIVLGLAYWGAHAADAGWMRVALAVAAPAVGFGIWGAVDPRHAGRHAEHLRLAEELLISVAAAAAVATAGRPTMGAALAGLSLLYHGLVYATGATLLGSSDPRMPADD